MTLQATQLKNQEGNAVIGIVLFIVVSALVFNLRTQIDARTAQVVDDSIIASFVQLSQAQYRHFTDPGAPTAGAYAATPALLVNRGYLPIWNGDENWSFNLGTGLVIEWVAPSLEAARSIQSRLPNLTNVTGTTVAVGFSDTQDLAILDSFVKKAGDSMQGALTFDAGIGNALDLNQNHIVDVGGLIVTSPDGSAVLEANATVTDTLVAGDFVIAN